MKSILIFAYYSYKDPVFQSAVLPYFIDFPHKDQYQFILLTFEQERFKLTSSEKKKLKKELSVHNILWIDSKWHSGNFKLLKKIYDLTAGMIKTVSLVRKYKVDAIYSEGFPGAVISYYVSRFTKRPHIVHTFEPHTDYMVESGVWKEADWEARKLRRFESVVGKKSFALMTATQAMIDKWKGKTGAQMFRVPSCVDINHFQFRWLDRMAIRKKYNIGDNEIVIVYLGKFGGMYMEKEMFDFFKETIALYNTGYAFRFMILSPDKKEKIEELISQSGIQKEHFIIESLHREQVPLYLSAADLALSGVRQYPSKRFCSPIKHGEYWACGLPVIIPDGVSDDYLLAEKLGIGWRLAAFTKESYDETMKKVMGEWRREKQEEFRQKTREFVVRDRNVKEYQRLYHEVFQLSENRPL